MGYSFRLVARVPLYATSHRKDSTYHGLCHTTSVIILQAIKAAEYIVKKEGNALLHKERVAHEYISKLSVTICPTPYNRK